MFDGNAANPVAEVTLDADAAWRLFFGLYSPVEVRASADVFGDEALASRVLGARAVMIRSAIDVG